MIASIILLSLGALMSTVFIISKVINYSFKTIILKTIASLFFVALAITTISYYGSRNLVFSILTVVGLFFGLLGDVFLGFKYITTKKRKLFIILGMFAFAIGHISYILALFLGFYIPGNIIYIFLPFILSIVLTSLYMCIAPMLGINVRKMIFFAIFYITCLTSMVSTALFMSILHQFKVVTLIMFFVGSLCFITSDFMLTGAYFKEGNRPKWYMAAYSVAYYLAQFLIAFSIFFLV